MLTEQWKAEAELEAQREMEENPEFFEELEEGAASAAKASSECSEVEANGRARHTIDPEVSGSFTKAETLDPPKLRTYSEYAKDDELEASRKALYDNIQATKDKYQAIMNSVPDNAAGTEASVMAEQLDEAADGIEGQAIGKKKKSQKRKKVAAALTQEGESLMMDEIKLTVQRRQKPSKLLPTFRLGSRAAHRSYRPQPPRRLSPF